MTMHAESTRIARDLIDQKLMRIIFAGLVLIVLLVALHQITKTSDQQNSRSAILREAEVFVFNDLREGTVLRNGSHDIIVEFAPGEGGIFEMLGTVIKRQRARHGAGMDIPILARLHEAKELTLYDPVLQQTYNMSSYGKDNMKQIVDYLIDQQQNPNHEQHGGPDGTPEF